MTPFASLGKTQRTPRLYVRQRTWLKPLLDKPGQNPAVVRRRQLRGQGAMRTDVPRRRSHTPFLDRIGIS